MAGLMIAAACLFVVAPILHDSGMPRLAGLVYWVVGGLLATAVMIVD